MLRNFLSGGDMTTLILQLLATTFVVFVTLPVHEFAHAWAATRLGDDTARLQGRLTLNPLAHLSPVGALMIYLMGFGFAKPVPVNMRRFRNPKQGMALTAVAGPVSNLIMAVVFLFLMHLVSSFASGNIRYYTVSFLHFAGLININLAVFNLLPIPPLDGSRVASLLVPDRYYYQMMKYEQIIMLALFALLAFGVLSKPLSVLSQLVYSGIDFVVSLPFGLLGA